MEPRKRKQRSYGFAAERISGHHMSRSGRGSIATIVQRGIGKTAKQAEIAARHRRFRRDDRHEPVTSRKLADKRRLHDHLDKKFSRDLTPGQMARVRKSLEHFKSHTHEWEDTHPKCSWEQVCTTCGMKGTMRSYGRRY